MAEKNKVIWSEGMFLRPQHFQQFERYLENTLAQRTAALHGFYWGFRHLAFDREALAIGKLVVTEAQGVLPDGTTFGFANPDDAPGALEVPAAAQDVRVMLALPRVRPGATEVQYEDEPDSLARYLVRETEVEDSGAIGMEPALLQVGRLRLRLMLETDMGDEWVGIGVARVIERRADNRLVLDERYIPPSLSFGEQPLLLGFAQELYGLLQARSEVLAARLSQPGRGGVSEVADFMLLETVNRYIGALWHMRQAGWLHPERLFHDWLMLACDLATYTSASRRPEVLPVYEHDDLQATFGALMDELRRSLSAVLEQHALQIPLQDRGQGVRVAQIPDLDLLRTAGFVLAVHAEIGRAHV